MRAALATLLVAAFWLTTKWSEAAGTVILVAVVSSLFAARPDPVDSAWGFFKGTLLALPFAFLVGQIALPALPGFGWFVVFVVPIMVPAALGMANPRHVGVATAFAINFFAFLSPHQAMTYDPGPFFAGSVSILVGILVAVGVFIACCPPTPGSPSIASCRPCGRIWPGFACMSACRGGRPSKALPTTGSTS
ncbi:hypothetical protein AJ88_34395 [Mesorhizobium amorphae CCBAU 01583]|nr:hypothetical protein AJ88_34395 [Mesorhizobium amorphae CCBAU 01583]